MKDRKMTEAEFYYVTLIDAPRETVWRALTNGEFTKQYWHNADVKSDWKIGSPVEFWVKAEKGSAIGCEGKVLECDVPSRLSYSWHFPLNPACAPESPSRVLFLLEDAGGATKLTVRHDEFVGEDSATYHMVSTGWPYVIAGLKTLCETGATRDFSVLAPD